MAPSDTAIRENHPHASKTHYGHCRHVWKRTVMLTRRAGGNEIAQLRQYHTRRAKVNLAVRCRPKAHDFRHLRAMCEITVPGMTGQIMLH